ncbi:hypothetical protein [Sphingopyxis flava]|uniref:Uncharacterized protein n=1 Tax=Sphingopyxis flava TaxID=1507287 RepID=A0A1T5AQF2_9SPHN|nr:hypothetical protein [Sphingopyxis flava]SKB36823.1 hypothetical protein SAMN06295937_100475 [Sphingopyxis flava]
MPRLRLAPWLLRIIEFGDQPPLFVALRFQALQHAVELLQLGLRGASVLGGRRCGFLPVELLLALRIGGEARAARGGEHTPAARPAIAARNLVQFGNGQIVERNDVRLAILRAIAGELPFPLGPVHFRPIKAGDFLAPLSCHDQQSDNRAEAAMARGRLGPDSGKLRVAKPAFARLDRRGCLHPSMGLRSMSPRLIAHLNRRRRTANTFRLLAIWSVGSRSNTATTSTRVTVGSGLSRRTGFTWSFSDRLTRVTQPLPLQACAIEGRRAFGS